MPKKPDAVERQAAAMEELDAAILADAALPVVEPDPPAPAPVVEPDPPASSDDWQHKYLSLKGKYDTEIPQLRTQVSNLTEQMQVLQAKPTPEPVIEPTPVAKLVTDKDVETFGEDLVDLMRRVASETDAGVKDKLQSEIDELRGKLPEIERNSKTAADNSVAQAQTAFFAELAKLVPDYEAVNVDEAFLGWLTLQDPLSGLVRNDMLQTAFHANDFKRTAMIFDAFKAETGRNAPPAPPPAPAPSLDREISPSTTRSAPVAPIEGQAKIWTSAELSEFFTQVARGDFKGNPEEAKRIDQEIDLAFSEGRVR